MIHQQRSYALDAPAPHAAAQVMRPEASDRQPDHAGHAWLDHTHARAFGEGAPAELRARASQRLGMLGEMTGGIAHDFRNILQVIESGLRLAERHAGEPEKACHFIAAAREGTTRGLKLTTQLLTFAKHRNLEARAVAVNEAVRTLEPLLGYAAGSGIRIALDLAPDVPSCLLDPSRFNAAMLNLVVNARDAMPSGGEIRISTTRCEATTASAGSPAPGEYVRIRIRDSGHGMSPDTLQQIFDPFFTTKGDRGTGLGLPQVCAFMRLMGGYVGCESAPGAGTTFDLLFPAIRLENDAAITGTPEPASQTIEALVSNRSRPGAGSRGELDRWVNEGGAPAGGTAPFAETRDAPADSR